MYRPLLIALFGLLTIATGGGLRGEVFVLTGGGRIEGELLNPKQSPRSSYLVKTSSGGEVTLDADRVARVVVKSEEMRQYEKFLPKMPPTAEGNWIMAQWCQRHGLEELQKFHLSQVITHKPDHAEARNQLGYEKVGDRWIIHEEFMRQRGMVRYKGRWRLAKEVALEEASDKRELAEKGWYRKLKMWRGWLGKKRSAEAVAEIKAIRDPVAIYALTKMLEDEKNQQVKLMLLDVLGELPSGRAVSKLAQTAIEDTDQTVRDRALSLLEKRGGRAAVSVFLQGLKSKDNRIINRSAVGLARLKAQQSVEPLIDVLTTKQKVVVKKGGGGGLGQIGANFGNGGSGLSAGGSTKVYERTLQNKGVLHALQTLTGETFAFNKEQWKAWYIEAHTPQDVDLRRFRD